MRGKSGPGLGARQASPRTLAIAGGVIVAVIVAVVLGIVLTQNGGSGSIGGSCDGTGDSPTICVATGTPATGSSTSDSAFVDAADVAKLFKGIPQDGFVLGNPDAPVTLVEWIDFQCPACQQFETEMLPELIEKYVRHGKMKIEMKAWNIIDSNFPGMHDSLRGQKVANAAAAQNKAFEFSEVLYNNQGVEGTGWLNDAMISNIGASVDGLNLSQLASDANSAKTASAIRAIDSYAAAQPTIFSGTPTLLLAKGKAEPKLYGSGVPDLANLEAAIDALLK